MNFYLDFEATQFSEKIISVGCVSEAGKSFYSLVRPVGKAKVTPFITELTGLTPEMVADAPTADEVFSNLRNFIRAEANGEETFFFVYGDCDKVFVERTAKYINLSEIKTFALNMSMSFIDYTKVVNSFFSVPNVALRKVCAYFRKSEVIQNHNALEDAEMLREIAINIAHSEKPAESPWAQPNNTNDTKKENENKLKNIPIRMTKENGATIDFKNRQAARDWVFENMFSKKQKATGDVSKKTITRRLNRCLNGIDTAYFKCKWEYKEVEV